jgi:glyoxylase-like metal-dependent hydrolase (beta-lactamase superfamily II)
MVYPCGDPPEAGNAIAIASEIFWIRMPLRFALSHINLWALWAIKDNDSWAIIDTGLQTEETAAAWSRLLAGPLNGKRPTCVLVTHMHSDHVEMAGWLTWKFDCPFSMTRLEYLSCRTLVADTGREAPEDGFRFYRRAGVG